MKYKCLNEKCGKVFLYPARETATSTIVKDGQDEYGTLETHVCPFCQGLELEEYTEPQPQIISVKSIPIEDADALIKEGYVVLEVYAKTVNLVKKQ